MAFFDDPKMLIAHLRHAFITSDETGISELVMINEDLDKEITSDRSIQKRSLRMAQLYNPTENFPKFAARSFDIQASPTLSRRPPLKNKSHMFQSAETRKRKRSNRQRLFVWQEGPGIESFEPEFFQKKEIPSKPEKVETSLLSELLAEYNKRTANPYFEYSKFSGANYGSASKNMYYVFLSMVKDRVKPVKLSILHKATVGDLVGLTFWKYLENGRGPVDFGNVNDYAVMIAEDDGDIDTDLPALEREDRIAKFRFTYLGIVKTKEKKEEQSPHTQLKHLAVKVYYEQGGFSTIAVDNLNIEMAEILSKVIRKRRLQIHDYELERKDSPGVSVDLNSLLRSQETMEFILVRNTGRHFSLSSELDDPSSGRGRIDTSVRAELTSHQYKSYRVTILHKVRTNTEVHLGVSAEGIEIDPIQQSRSSLHSLLRSSQKPTTYEIKKICACELLEERPNQRMSFKMVRLGKENNFKSNEFEAPASIAKEIVHKINLILDGLTSGARTGYADWKEGRGRKGSKTSS